jgi:hypothetical protein
MEEDAYLAMIMARSALHEPVTAKRLFGGEAD